LPKRYSEDELDQQIIHTVETAKPENVQQLIDQVQALSSKPKQEILNRIMHLEQEEKIHLKPLQTPTPEKFSSYIRSNHAVWYWITMAFTLTTMLIAFVVPENDFPLVYVRYVLGIIFILWLPGYAFIKALFPQTLPFERAIAHSLGTTEKDVDIIERVALSMGMSIALVPIVGLLLNYTPWGIRLTPIVLSLTALTLAFATAAITREYQITIKRALGSVPSTRIGHSE
jgi:small-conductance mechanosensitive channel